MSEYATKDDVREIVGEAVQEIVGILKDSMDHVDVRFNGVESRLDGVESRLDGVESRLDGVESRLGRVESRLDSMDRRLGNLEILVQNLQNEQIAMSADIKDILINLDQLEKRLNSQGKEQERAKKELLKLHDWVVRAGKKIDLEFQSH